MTKSTWNKFVKAKERFRSETEELTHILPQLKNIQQGFANSRADGKNSSYTVETPVVYNSALDDISKDDEIKLILVADNPGRREQAAENRRYLVGPSGKIAGKFFSDNPALGIDFLRNVIILNKTPIHSARTAELRELCRIEAKAGRRLDKNQFSGFSIAAALEKSQKTMAALLLEFHGALGTPVWITGYSEMKKGGIFESYTETLKKLYSNREKMYNQILLYRHFSMNQFTIDLKQQTLRGESITECLERIGAVYRERFLGR